MNHSVGKTLDNIKKEASYNKEVIKNFMVSVDNITNMSWLMRSIFIVAVYQTQL